MHTKGCYGFTRLLNMHYPFGERKPCAKPLHPIDQRVPLLRLPRNEFLRTVGAIAKHIRTRKT